MYCDDKDALLIVGAALGAFVEQANAEPSAESE